MVAAVKSKRAVEVNGIWSEIEVVGGLCDREQNSPLNLYADERSVDALDCPFPTDESPLWMNDAARHNRDGGETSCFHDRHRFGAFWSSIQNDVCRLDLLSIFAPYRGLDVSHPCDFPYDDHLCANVTSSLDVRHGDVRCRVCCCRVSNLTRGAMTMALDDPPRPLAALPLHGYSLRLSRPT